MSGTAGPFPALLLLARHGETDWNRERRLQGHSDVPLNDEGRRQARLLAARIATFPVDALHTSDLLRAAETAAIVGEAAGVRPVASPDWRELRLGVLEGTPGVESQRRHGELISAAVRSVGPLGEGAETFAEFRDRIVGAYDRIARDHSGRTVAVVSHGGALKTLIAHLIGLPAIHVDRLSLRANAGLTVIDFRHGRPQLVALNDTRHLE